MQVPTSITPFKATDTTVLAAVAALTHTSLHSLIRVLQCPRGGVPQP